MSKLKKITVHLNCSCPKADVKGFCRTKKCPIYAEFTNFESIRDYDKIEMLHMKINVDISKEF